MTDTQYKYQSRVWTDIMKNGKEIFDQAWIEKTYLDKAGMEMNVVRLLNAIINHQLYKNILSKSIKFLYQEISQISLYGFNII